MIERSTYRNVATDAEFRAAYNEYQSRYAKEPKESDKILLSLIGEALRNCKDPKLLDIGCSTGNLLGHIRRAFPDVHLFGGDLAESSLAIAHEVLPSVDFRKMDMLDLPFRGDLDIVTANAVTVYFTDEEYALAIQSVFRSLGPRGVYVAFEWLHDFDDQQLVITEKSPAHPDGLTFFFRPQAGARRVAMECGFSEITFRPFFIPIDIPLAERADGAIATHTLRTTEGRRLSMRGTLLQPWCFFVAKKR